MTPLLTSLRALVARAPALDRPVLAEAIAALSAQELAIAAEAGRRMDAAALAEQEAEPIGYAIICGDEKEEIGFGPPPLEDEAVVLLYASPPARTPMTERCGNVDHLRQQCTLPNGHAGRHSRMAPKGE